MAKRRERERALELRLQGYSFNYIKDVVGVSKGTLSVWLNKFPLSDERVQELRGKNQRRIERFRNTMAKKRKFALDQVFKVAGNEIGVLTEREVFLCGLFLYWGEGAKTSRSQISLSNTDPSMVCFYMRWVRFLGAQEEKIRLILQLYADMDIEKEVLFWKSVTGVARENIRIYAKKSKQCDLSYKIGFGHGTCMVRYGNQKVTDKIMMSLEYLKKTFL